MTTHRERDRLIEQLIDATEAVWPGVQLVTTYSRNEYGMGAFSVVVARGRYAEPVRLAADQVGQALFHAALPAEAREVE